MNGPHNPIGWTDFTWNPIKGLCPVACPYCYARRMYTRFKWDPTIRLDRKELQAPYKLKNRNARIFVGSTIELFGDLIHPWLDDIIQVARDNPDLTFQFLTQIPQVMRDSHFPDNCWCGVTVTNPDSIYRIAYLRGVDAKCKFISFEPLHQDFGYSRLDLYKIDWMIIGAETGNRKGKSTPRQELISYLLFKADECKIPVFMKNNLKPFWHGNLRQEFPKKK